MKAIALLTAVIIPSTLLAQTQPTTWTAAKTQAILEKTAVTRLAPELSGLTALEKKAIPDLLEVGKIMQDLYELSRHPQALTARASLDRDAAAKKSADLQGLRRLYRLNSGPTTINLDNQREAFLPVEPVTGGKNVYPLGITKDEVDLYVAVNPSQRDSILGERTVVRRSTSANLKADLATLDKYPVIAALHPAVRPELTAGLKKPDPKRLYAVPYSLAYAPQLVRAHDLLRRAADTLEPDDSEFARFLRNRARDFVTNDYESGDASWITGRFKRLNAQIGSYETYDDALYGAKAFHSFTLLLNDEKATNDVRSAIKGLQEIEDALPYQAQKKVREDIPVGVYDVVADFGQSRGGNTATILPNDALFSRRYGRTILLRRNIMTDPEIFGNSLRAWQSVVAPKHRDQLKPDGDFYRTLWHEIGHYLGVDRAKDGRDLAIALEDNADSIEEMKADLVSLNSIPYLRGKGYYNDAKVSAVHAAGIRRTLQTARPRDDQPYQRMQLVQFNYFMEKGLLSFDRQSGTLSIDYSRYPKTIASLLKEVLALQHEGDKARAARFYEKYSSWDPAVHDVIAGKMKEAQGKRFRIFEYAALGE